MILISTWLWKMLHMQVQSEPYHRVLSILSRNRDIWRIDWIDKASRGVVTSLASLFLRTLFKHKSSLLFNEFTESSSFRKLFHGVAILLRRKCVLGSFPYVCSRENWKGSLRVVIFWSGLSILFSSHQIIFCRACFF